MKPITDLTGVRRGANPYLPTGVSKIVNVGWVRLTDNNGTPLHNDAGEEYKPVLAFELEGKDWARVPRTTPRYTENLSPIENGGEVLDLVRTALEKATYEEVVDALSSLKGRTIKVSRTPMRLIKNDLTPYVGQIVKVEFVAEQQAQPQTTSPATAVQP